MQFIRANSPEPAAEHIARLVTRALKQNKRVLWLVSGGSSIEVAMQARNKLASSNNLVVMQVDERFGPVGHADSNWQQLLDAGFSLQDTEHRPVLTGEGIDATTRNYEHTLEAALRVTDFRLGLFGIGTDGHTAGILPDSPAANSEKLAVAYQAQDFWRITITPAAIAKLDVAIAWAAGGDKAGPLVQLHQRMAIAKQPAQALKLAKNSYVYNNHMEGSVK